MTYDRSVVSILRNLMDYVLSGIGSFLTCLFILMNIYFACGYNAPNREFPFWISVIFNGVLALSIPFGIGFRYYLKRRRK
jgi:hypothetical protein